MRVFISFLYTPVPAVIVRDLPLHRCKAIFKGNFTLKSILMKPKDKNHNILSKMWSTNGSIPSRTVISSPLLNPDRVKEHSSKVTREIYVYCKSNNHPQAGISHFGMIGQDSKQVARYVREAIHIRINKLISIVILVKRISQIYSINFWE